MKKNCNQNEQGRSMVEMLGVLAVIGVLTIIGVAGFRYAMNKHYANQTVNRLMKRAVVVAAQANFGQPLSLHEFDENDGEYKITLLDPTNNESFTMQVEDIPQEVCQQILGMDWKLAKMNPDNCSEETINFMFLNELTDCSTCVPDSVDCPPENEMQCGKCSVVKGFMDNNDDCEGNSNGEYCVRGKCTTCAKGQFWFSSKNQCYLCDKNKNEVSPEIFKHHCLGTMFYVHSAGRMRGCLRSHELNEGADELSCKQCLEHCYLPSRQACPLTGSGYKRKSITDGECVPDCLIGQFWHSHYCYTCNNNGNEISLPEFKHHCLGTMFYNNDSQRMWGCLRTDWQAISNTDEASCTECKDSTGKKNRCYLNGTCYLAGAGQAHQRVSDEDGTCQQ